MNYANSAGSVDWGNVSGKPTGYPPSSHNHDSVYSKAAPVVLYAPVEYTVPELCTRKAFARFVSLEPLPIIKGLSNVPSFLAESLLYLPIAKLHQPIACVPLPNAVDSIQEPYILREHTTQQVRITQNILNGWIKIL